MTIEKNVLIISGILAKYTRELNDLYEKLQKQEADSEKNKEF